MSLSAEAVVSYPAAAYVWNQVHVGVETLQLSAVCTWQKHGNPIAYNILSYLNVALLSSDIDPCLALSTKKYCKKH
jgi:hypothetical protein